MACPFRWVHGPGSYRKRKGLIVDGVSIQMGAWPWMALIQKKVRSNHLWRVYSDGCKAVDGVDTDKGKVELSMACPFRWARDREWC